MSIEEFLQWGDVHNYPKLVLGEGDVLSSGPCAWYLLLLDTDVRIARAIARVTAWQKRLEQEREARG